MKSDIGLGRKQQEHLQPAARVYSEASNLLPPLEPPPPTSPFETIVTAMGHEEHARPKRFIRNLREKPTNSKNTSILRKACTFHTNSNRNSSCYYVKISTGRRMTSGVLRIGLSFYALNTERQ
ncbi:uncharacterized protein LOC113506503 [Trichoplusia ni]|uniref:Uncharacterized protein LOC113506503 n=1 Tax=Trichoplusia ni TaxID=7111 RepID=A0A7E5WXX4_TRINI|nr:uncharacterized protein LOC113506503 [Trichoplusia ni]